MILGTYEGWGSTLITGKFNQKQHEEILIAICKQRWFHFRKTEGFVFDRDSGLLWNTEVGHPYQQENNGTYKREDAQKILRQLSIDRIEDWTFPTEEEYSLLVNELGMSDFPYYHLLQFPPLFQTEIGLPLPQLESGSLLVCSHGFLTQNYRDAVQRQFPEYTAQFTLELFLSQRLFPVFQEEKINFLYRQALDDYKLTKKRSKTPYNHDTRLIFLFNAKEISQHFEEENVDQSFLQYAYAVQKASHFFMEKLSQYEEVNEEYLDEFQRIRQKLSRKYQYSNHLSPEENQELATQGEFFQKHFAFGTDGIRKQFLNILAQGQSIEQSVDEINQTDQSLLLLAKLEKEERVSFVLLLENMSNILCKSILHMEFFQEHQDFVTTSLSAWEEFQEDYKDLKRRQFPQLTKLCKEMKIPAPICQSWLHQWGTLRFSLETLLTPLLEFALKGNLLEKDEEGITPVEDLVEILSNYKSAVDHYFLEKRVPLERKYMQQNNPFQSNTPNTFSAFFTSQIELYELSCDFLEDFTDILFLIPLIPVRQFLLLWVKPIFSIQVEGVLQYLSTQDTSREHQSLVRDFSWFKQENLLPYVYHRKEILSALESRGADFSLLLQRLENKYNEQMVTLPSPPPPTEKTEARLDELVDVLLHRKEETPSEDV